MAFFLDSVSLGLQYAMLASGVYITFRVLGIPDLTVDGSFTLGIAVSAVFAVKGHPFWGLLFAVLAGAAAGIVTGFLQTKAGIHPILAGILTMSGLYTVNITVMQSPNLSLIDSEKFFTFAYNVFPAVDKSIIKLISALILCSIVTLLLALFFKTVLGLCIRATGNNESMVRASSINTTMTKMVALAIANGLVALSGGMVAQYQGFADINSGSGMIVVGLASVIIGEAVFGRRSLTAGLISAVCGSVIYRILTAFALEWNILSANSLKLLCAVIVAVTLAAPTIKKTVLDYKARREARRNA